MIEIFKTNVLGKSDAEKLLQILTDTFPCASINFDLTDCDKVLRVEANEINADKVTSIVNSWGFTCKIIPDKICK
ncbi:MAG: hypothetical protein K0S33_2919 [Bacteroidetes bacterium]|jgi:hypothetical protein|nr:hypothetical protein [Bacteroidota bacterium]